LLLASGHAFAEETSIGSVKTVEGEAFIERGDQNIVAAINLRLFQNDTLITGTDGKLGVIFKDDTVLSLGPDSRLTVDEFIFDPAKDNFSMITRLLKGTAAYLSGKIGKLAPEAVKFETPVASLGIRGTRFVAKVEGE
jgi:hypothetical protein